MGKGTGAASDCGPSSLVVLELVEQHCSLQRQSETNYELSAQLNGAASPAWTAELSETTAAMVPATVMNDETAIMIRQTATPIHHFVPRSDDGRVRRVSHIHMAAGMVTARGVPTRELINVRRSLKTGIALARRKSRIPVPTTHPLEMVSAGSIPGTRGTHVQAVQCCQVLSVK